MFSQEQVDQFKIEDGQDIPSGVTAELLANLHDVVHKFGVIDQKDRMRRIFKDEPYEIYVAAPNDSARKSMLIVGQGRCASEGTYVIRISGTTPDIILWDMRVTAESMKRFMAGIDAIANEHGHIDPVTGERLQLNVTSCGGKWRVEDVFKKPGSAMLVAPRGLSAEQLLLEFDHPELLMVVTTIFGDESIIKKDSLSHHQHRVQVVRDLFQEEGIDINAARTVHPSRIMGILEKVEQRMKQ